MISWIQRTFQHHFRAVFAVLLAGTIISFIMTIGAVPSLAPSQRNTTVDRDFFGYNLSSGTDMRTVMSDAALSIDLEYGDQAAHSIDQDRLQTMALQRVAGLHLADQWHIPAATADEQIDFIKSLGKFTDDKGQFDANAYNSYRTTLQSNNPAGEGEISHIINDEVRLRKVQELLNGPGYVLPSDVMSMLARSETSWTVSTATVDFTSYHPTINPSDADLQKYYKDNEFRYQIPPQTNAVAVDFQASEYLAQVKVTDAEVKAYYDADPAKFPKAAPAKSPAPAVAAKADPAADFAAVRPQVESALRAERAKQLAEKAASDFAYALYQNKTASGGPTPEAFAASRNLAVTPLAAFSQQSGPSEFGSAPEVAEASAKLDADHAFSDAIATPFGAGVMIWKSSMPARQPLLAEVKAKVQADYVENERHKRFTDMGKTLKTAVEARLKAGDTFDKAIASASASQSVKAETKTLPAFTMRTRPQDLAPAVAGTLDHLDKGQVSDLTIDGDKGYLVYAADKKIPALTESNPQYAAMRSSISGYMARSTSQSYLAELVTQELKRTAPVAQ